MLQSRGVQGQACQAQGAMYVFDEILIFPVLYVRCHSS